MIFIIIISDIQRQDMVDKTMLWQQRNKQTDARQRDIELGESAKSIYHATGSREYTIIV